MSELAAMEQQQIVANVPLFLKKLWKMVHDEDSDEIISWNSTGNGFVIRDQFQFVSELLPRYFKHNNLASFIRQLNFYSFHKVPSIDSEDIQFAHNNFLKGKPQMLVHIKRKVNVPQKFSKDKDKEKDFETLLDGVKDLQNKHSSVDRGLKLLKQENAALWHEISSLRMKYSKQTNIINKLIHFLISYMHSHRNSFNKPNVTVTRKCDPKNLHAGPTLLEIDYHEPKKNAKRVKPNAHSNRSDNNEAVTYSFNLPELQPIVGNSLESLLSLNELRANEDNCMQDGREGNVDSLQKIATLIDERNRSRALRYPSKQSKKELQSNSGSLEGVLTSGQPFTVTSPNWDTNDEMLTGIQDSLEGILTEKLSDTGDIVYSLEYPSNIYNKADSTQKVSSSGTNINSTGAKKYLERYFKQEMDTDVNSLEENVSEPYLVTSPDGHFEQDGQSQIEECSSDGLNTAGTVYMANDPETYEIETDMSQNFGYKCPEKHSTNDIQENVSSLEEILSLNEIDPKTGDYYTNNQPECGDELLPSVEPRSIMTSNNATEMPDSDANLASFVEYPEVDYEEDIPELVEIATSVERGRIGSSESRPEKQINNQPPKFSFGKPENCKVTNRAVKNPKKLIKKNMPSNVTKGKKSSMKSNIFQESARGKTIQNNPGRPLDKISIKKMDPGGSGTRSSKYKRKRTEELADNNNANVLEDVLFATEPNYFDVARQPEEVGEYIPLNDLSDYLEDKIPESEINAVVETPRKETEARVATDDLETPPLLETGNVVKFNMPQNANEDFGLYIDNTQAQLNLLQEMLENITDSYDDGHEVTDDGAAKEKTVALRSERQNTLLYNFSKKEILNQSSTSNFNNLNPGLSSVDEYFN